MSTTYTVKRAAKKLGLSTRTVYRLLESKELQGTKAGRSWLVTHEALENYLKERLNFHSHDEHENFELLGDDVQPFEDWDDLMSDDIDRPAASGKTSARAPRAGARPLGRAPRANARPLGGKNETVKRNYQGRVANRVSPINDPQQGLLKLNQWHVKEQLDPHAELRLLLEYQFANGDSLLDELPVVVENKDDAIQIHGKNEHGEDQSIFIKKLGSLTNAMFHVLRAVPGLLKRITPYYDQSNASFDWERIFEQDWDNSQLPALQWAAHLGSDKTITTNKYAPVEDKLALLPLMEKPLQKACLESLAILHEIDV